MWTRVDSAVIQTALAGVVLLGCGPIQAADRAAFGQVHAADPPGNYLLHCAGCHQADGRGLPRSGIPSMTGNVGYFLNSEAGRAFLVQVPGTANSPLSDEQVAELLNWIVEQFSAAQKPPQSVAYTSEEVKRLRTHRLTDLYATRRAIINELNAAGLPAQ